MIIVGLGNPDTTYAETRHNLGFQVVDAVATHFGLDWSRTRDVMAARRDEVWLIKPWTYMNNSGPALRDFCIHKNISTDSADLHRDLMVIHDELDFAPGIVKFQRDRSSAGHHGVQSLIDALQTKDFRRLRIGIGNNQAIGMPAEAYVLQQPPAPERQALSEARQQATQQVIDLIEKKEAQPPVMPIQETGAT